MITSHDVHKFFLKRGRDPILIRVSGIIEYGFSFKETILEADQATQAIADQINAKSNDELALCAFMMVQDKNIKPNSPIMSAIRLELQRRGLYEPDRAPLEKHRVVPETD